MKTRLMIKKTMTITSIAILFAAISVATTMTMVQADPEVGTIATFGPNFGTDGVTLNPILGIPMNHDYSDVAASDAGTIAFTNAASLPGGYFDAVEPTFQGGGAAPIPDLPSPITLYLAGGGGAVTPLLEITEGYEEARYTFTAPFPGQNYFLGTIISDMDDFGLFLDPAGVMTPAPETVFVSVNGVDLLASVTAVPGSGASQVITTAHGVVKAAPAGGIVVGFNEIFVWDPAAIPALPCAVNPTPTLPCPGSQTGVRVEQITILQASQSHGFWKNHPTVVDALPDVDLYGTHGDWLVDADVGDEVVFDGGKKNNAYNKLAIELLAALLNVENGSTCTAPATAIDDAQKLLFDASWTIPDSVDKPSKTMSPTNAEINAVKDTLDDYNNNIGC